MCIRDRVNVTDADNKLHTYYQGVSGVTIDLVGGSNASVDAKTTVTPTLKVSGIDVYKRQPLTIRTGRSYIALVSSVTGQELTVLDSAGQNVLN